MLHYLHNENLGKLVLRLSVAVLFLLHGYAKIGNDGAIDFIGGSLNELGLPAIIAYGVYVGEVLAPLMVIAGYRCRLGGLLIVATMIMAIVLVHTDEIFALTGTGGWAIELQGMYLFGGLAIALLGSGRYAIKPD